MVKFAKFSKAEHKIVIGIADRAISAGIYKNRLDADMDISAVHASCPLRLMDLLEADQFNFAHDMYGIRRHLNRQTGEFEDLFLPRFAQPSA